jgi:hypothetical protein
VSGGTGSHREITVGRGWRPVFTTSERPSGLLVARVNLAETIRREVDDLSDHLDRVVSEYVNE